MLAHPRLGPFPTSQMQAVGASPESPRVTLLPPPTQVMQLLMKGNRQRTQEPTAANQTSSRSHAVLQVAVRQRSRVPNVLQEVRQGRLFMIDLAGSERAAQVRPVPLGLGDWLLGWGRARALPKSLRREEGPSPVSHSLCPPARSLLPGSGLGPAPLLQANLEVSWSPER